MTDTREDPLSANKAKDELNDLDPPTFDNPLVNEDAPTLMMGAEHLESSGNGGSSDDPEFFSGDDGDTGSDNDYSVKPPPGIEDMFAEAVEAVEAVKAELKAENVEPRAESDGPPVEEAVEMEILGPEEDDEVVILESEDDAPSLATEQAARIEALEEQIAASEKDYKALNSRYLRTAADYENFRKRSQREKEETRKYGSERLLTDFLPVIDNLGRAIQHVTTSGDAEADKSFMEGVQMVLRQFEQQLVKHGVAGFDSEGKKFDPQFHEAVQQVTTTEHPTGTIMNEFQKGYVVHERLLRPALVVVAHNPGGGETAAAEESPEAVVEEIVEEVVEESEAVVEPQEDTTE
jgi:molecular chaperone GrpE